MMMMMMIMQMRCESAVAQGLRSEILQETKKAESASMRPTPPSPPLACWLRTSPHSKPASLPNAPTSQTWLAFEKNSLCHVQLNLYANSVYWLFPNAHTTNITVEPLVDPARPLLYPSEIYKGAECVPVWWSRCSARGCWSAAVLDGHSASAAAKWWPANGKVKQTALYGALWWWQTPRPCVCCACITGTITCTNCPVSQVVRYHAHIKCMAIYFF